MSDVSQRCVSLGTGALSPDLRVNYPFGLVLGVDEFRQEQLYFLEKEYLHNRALHGYGTVVGLRVRVERPTEGTGDVQVMVERGIGIDQWGRPIVVRSEQCARLGAWLAAQVRARPGTLAERRGADGWLRVCVVASYDECEDELVPIPGQPCSTAEATRAPSRIRDSFKLELRWQPPAMPAWDVVRRFADLMATVRIEPRLPPDESSEPTIVERVRALGQPDSGSSGGSGPPEPPRPLWLPAATAREALDRIFAVWVTEVRPRLVPDLIEPDPDAEAGVLLACIDFRPDDAFDPTNPGIADVREPDDAGRPFLLHTQLVQELLLLGGSRDEHEREFATVEVLSGSLLHAWVHHPEPLQRLGGPADAFAVTSDGAARSVVGAERLPGAANVFRIAVRGENAIEPGARVEVRFALRALRVPSGESLAVAIDRLAYAYVGRDGETITAHTIADQLARVRELATLETALVADEPPRLRAWFHTDGPLRLPGQVSVRRGLDGATAAFGTRSLTGDAFAFEWELLPPSGAPLQDGELLTVSFDPRATHVRRSGGETDLHSLVSGQRLAVTGNRGDAIELFHRVDLPAATARPERSFSTLRVRGGRVVHAWLHHPVALDPPTNPGAGLALASDGRSLTIERITALPGLDNLFEVVTRPNTLINPGERVEARFDLGAWVERGGGPVLARVDDLPFGYVGRDGGSVLAHTIADRFPAVREFVTLDSLVVDGVPRLRAWFHSAQRLRLPSSVAVRRGVGGAPVSFATRSRDGQPFSLDWELTPPAGQPLVEDELIAVSFDATAIQAQIAGGGTPLTSILREQWPALVGYDGDATIEAFCEVDLPTPPSQPGPSREEIIREVLRLPTQPFVTITPLGIDAERGRLEFELWFHPDLDPRLDRARVVDPTFEVLVELTPPPDTPAQLPLIGMNQGQHNVFVASFHLGAWQQLKTSPYLRFAFPVDANSVVHDGAETSLRDYVDQFRVKFEGHREDVIVVHVRVPNALRG